MSYIFGEFAKQIKPKLTPYKISHLIFSDEFVQEWIIATIQRRLNNDGEDADGDLLRTDNALAGNTTGGFYSEFTEKLKKTKRPVTLNDTGDFYNSFDIVAEKTFYDLEADFKNGEMYLNFMSSYNTKNDFFAAILNMNESEMAIFIDNVFRPRFVHTLRIEFGLMISKSK